MDIQALFEQHGGRLLRAAYLMSQNGQDARDLVQETFCQALEARARFRGESNEYTWLYAILRNQFRIHCRKNSRWFPLDLLFDHPAEKVDPWSGRDRVEQQQCLERALSRLPFKYRELLLLRYVEEMKVDEIARLLRIAPGTVKSRLHIATRKLQAKLARGKGNSVLVAGGRNHEL
jgi:RNA polymerase sigma-70 factor (ECF subfamily)